MIDYHKRSPFFSSKPSLPPPFLLISQQTTTKKRFNKSALPSWTSQRRTGAFDDDCKTQKDVDVAMKRAREAAKELERKTEALASTRGTGNEGGGALILEREKRRPKRDERREEKENGQSTATRRAKKTKACAKEKDRETKKTKEDETKWSLFPAMTPRKPPQSARGRGKGIAAEIARRKKEDGRDEGIWKTRTATKKKTITTAMTARETKKEREKYATGDGGEYHRLESLSSSKSNSRDYRQRYHFITSRKTIERRY